MPGVSGWRRPRSGQAGRRHKVRGRRMVGRFARIYIACPLDLRCGRRGGAVWGLASQTPAAVGAGLADGGRGHIVGVEDDQQPPTTIRMTLKILLRRVQDFSGFVIKSARIVGRGKQMRIEARLEPDPRRRRRCSCCGAAGRVHDKLPVRRWHFVPLWNIPVLLYYAPRRVICPLGGPKVEAMPWNIRHGGGKHRREHDHERGDPSGLHSGSWLIGREC